MPMDPYVIVLAQTSHEGAKYVRRAGLPRGRWRIAARASSIRGIRKAQVHCLPGFHKRPDRHSILAELRYAQCEWLDVEMPPKPEAPVVDQGDGMGQQLTLEEAFARQAEIRAGAESEIATVLTLKDALALEGDALGAFREKVLEKPGANADELVVAIDAKVEFNKETLAAVSAWMRDVPPDMLAEELAKVEAEEARYVDVPDPAVALDDRRRFPTTRQVEAAYRYNRLLTKADIVERQVPALERGMPTDQVATIGKAKRRRRCDTCGELHFKDEPCSRTDGVPEETPVVTPATMFD